MYLRDTSVFIPDSISGIVDTITSARAHRHAYSVIVVLCASVVVSVVILSMRSPVLSRKFSSVQFLALAKAGLSQLFVSCRPS